MWSAVTSGDISEPAPVTRCKHSATLLQGNVYLLGGRNGNVPLKDFWRYNLACGRWQLVEAAGERPPCLQEHTAVAHGDCIYVFGGEVGFSAASETPLWIYDAGRGTWRKVRARSGAATPRGRRGHTALVHRGAMLVYGGYQDLRGSCADLWAFHFDTESWHLVSGGGPVPPPRHRHSAVLHGDAMWVYGGMTDLVARSDLWRWDLAGRMWHAVPQRHGPGALHGHAAAAAAAHMLLFGGEVHGIAQNDLWKFHFDTVMWEKVTVNGMKPAPRADCVALTVSALLLQGTTGSTCPTLESRMARTRQRTAPTPRYNRVAPCETTYRPDAPTAPVAAASFIQRLARRPPGPTYTVLHADSSDSVADALDLDAAPTRLPKSRSAGHLKKKALARDPVSVPNFAEAARLVLLHDSDEDDSGIIEVKPASISTDNTNGPSTGKKVVIYEHFKAVRRGDSYNSHVGYADNPLYDATTSDYASLETMCSGPGPFGFCNPNYLGPELLETESGDTCRRQAAAALLGTNDSSPEAVQSLELQSVVRVGRASSASRAHGPPPALYIFIVGGKERGQVTVFKRPVSLWKLQLY